MKKLLNRSFRNRLFAAFLVISLVPLLVCSVIMLQIFRIRMNEDAQKTAQEQMQTILDSLDSMFSGIDGVAEQIQNSDLLVKTIEDGGSADTDVYSELFKVIGDMRAYARFDLYDIEGNWRYSTQQIPNESKMPTNWGPFYAASRGDEGISYVSCLDATDTSAPLLQGGVLLESPDGESVGYLLISVFQSNFSQLLDGKYGTQNDIILLNRYWRPVYCAQPSLAESLAPILREQLLTEGSMKGISENFIYTVMNHPQSGLYLVFQQPQVFNRETMVGLYTVSFSCALICVVISVLMSFNLSQQMFRPIQRLHKGIREVENNNLDVYVPSERNDELGELADKFNGMVVALKHNQKQLVENQRELNEAQIRMMQAQLNPHFLCNTLDTMKWISKINQVPQVALMSTDLADILRFCISPEEFVTLDREMEILKRYIEIQKIRLSDTMEFYVELPPELETCLVPKMILQPIVENAVLHGLGGVENGVIRVRAWSTKDETLCVSVTDNGKGMPPELAGRHYNLNRDETAGHLGLYNVNTILTKYYGDGYGLYLDNAAEGHGAVVTATLPLRREEDAEC